MQGHDFAAIRQKFILSQVASKVVKLRRSGKEWSGCCPFHNEKTPSFTGNDEKEFYHCFGCGAHGDVVDFVANIEKIDTAAAIASLTGGRPPRLTDADRTSREEWLKQRDTDETVRRAEGIAKARQRWERATPVDGYNGYLDRKKVAPHLCRTEGENLLVPMWDEDGDIINVQSIPAKDGHKKLFQAGAPTETAKARLMIGIHLGRTIICEGYATGATVYEATADRVCIAFSAGNIGNIARDMVESGTTIVIAADRKAMKAMLALGEELKIPVVFPPDLGDGNGDDFNDQMIAQGIDAVRATIAQGLIDYANAPPPLPDPPFCAISFIDAMAFDEEDIPLRPWIVPGALLAGSTHILAAPGGTGKSLFTLQMAIMLATGEAWGKWQPRKACKVLIVNAEDDVDEQRRRISAARTVMDIHPRDVAGRIIMADNPSSILMSGLDPAKKALCATPLVAQLSAVIRHHGIDVVIVDPFAETFEGDENSNNDTKWAMKVWRDQIARACGCAVYLVHHTTKNAGDKAGSADAIRGAGALVNSARLAATLFVMTKDEAPLLGVDEEQRFRYVRYDDAKSNQSLIGSRQWFEKVSVVINNGPQGDSDGGDEVGALRPWHPKGIGAYDPPALMSLLHSIDAGYVDENGVFTDIPFGRSQAGKSKRWIGSLIGDRLGLDEAQIKVAIQLFFDAQIIEEYDFRDEEKGRNAKGIRANISNASRILGLSDPPKGVGVIGE